MTRRNIRVLVPLAALVLATCATQPSSLPNPEPVPAMHVPGKATSSQSAPGLPLLAMMARDAIVAHAPYKQYDPASGRPVERVGQTPATACDAMIFLVAYLRHGVDDQAAREKFHSLAAWVIAHQHAVERAYGVAAVPSMPDAMPPDDRYFYAIDAAICGRAMLVAHRHTREAAFLESAVGFGDFLEHLAQAQEQVFERSKSSGAFCEYARPEGPGLAYNCDTYVKNILAVGFLRDLASETGAKHYMRRATVARDFLLPGLQGKWEYAAATAALSCRRSSCPIRWRRVSGPHGEVDRFIYGDTLAYALAGLHEFEGASDEVLRLYREIVGFKGTSGRTRSYDGTVAWAGYVDARAEAPDPGSAYYDLVTIGILNPLRRDAAPEHNVRAHSFATDIAERDGPPPWGVSFDGQSIGIDVVDLTTLSALGTAVLKPCPPQLDRGDPSCA